MLDATKLILKRMETNPEEFSYREPKWAHLINYYESCLPKEDLDALKEGVNKCRQQEFMGEVMQTLAGEQGKRKNKRYEIEPELTETLPVEVKYEPEDPFGEVPVKREGEMVSYDSATDAFSYAWRKP